MKNIPEEHYEDVIEAIEWGQLVFFLGAGANLCNRPENEEWRPSQKDYLPSAGELSRHLADEYKYPFDDKDNLSRVSQFTSMKKGSGVLYRKLHEIFSPEHPPTSLHTFLAALPGELTSRGYPRKGLYRFLGRLVIMTTNYDDLLERAFRAKGQAYHVVWYVADGKERGKCYYRSPDGHVKLIENAPDEEALREARDPHPVILKIHGAIDREAGGNDSFVITEDHYIEYLTRTSLAGLFPQPLPEVLKNSHFLFLGYSLQDWNFRVILHRIWGDQTLSFRSWAIQHPVKEVDRVFWESRKVGLLDVDLKDYVAALQRRVESLEGAENAS